MFFAEKCFILIFIFLNYANFLLSDKNNKIIIINGQSNQGNNGATENNNFMIIEENKFKRKKKGNMIIILRNDGNNSNGKNTNTNYKPPFTWMPFPFFLIPASLPISHGFSPSHYSMYQSFESNDLQQVNNLQQPEQIQQLLQYLEKPQFNHEKSHNRLTQFQHQSDPIYQQNLHQLYRSPLLKQKNLFTVTIPYQNIQTFNPQILQYLPTSTFQPSLNIPCNEAKINKDCNQVQTNFIVIPFALVPQNSLHKMQNDEVFSKEQENR